MNPPAPDPAAPEPAAPDPGVLRPAPADAGPSSWPWAGRIAVVALMLAQFAAGYIPIGFDWPYTVGSRSEQYRSAIVPADLAFIVIWPLIYLGLLAFAFWQLRVRRAEDMHLAVRLAGPALLVALTNAAYVLHVAADGFTPWTHAILLLDAAAALWAARIAQHAAPGRGRVFALAVKLPFHLLAGWLTLALAVNLAAFLIARPDIPLDPRDPHAALPLLIAVICVGVVLTLWLGSLAYAGALAWGLGGIVARNLAATDYAWIAFTACLGMVLILSAWVVRLWRGARPRRPQVN